MKLIKLLCGIGFLVVLASNISTISRWSESRGVYDDICYLRQAHLFKLFGLDGLNTDLKREDDQYLANKLKEIGLSRVERDDAGSLSRLDGEDEKNRPFNIHLGPGSCWRCSRKAFRSYRSMFWRRS